MLISCTTRCPLSFKATPYLIVTGFNMPFHCCGSYSSKCARNQIWKCCCHSCHTRMGSLLTPWTILWEKQQLWTLSQKHVETLYLLPLMTALRVTCWAAWSGNVLSEAVSSSHLWIWGGLLSWCTVKVGWGRKSFPTNWKRNALISVE